MLVDYERAWMKLKTEIGQKRSHGQDGLFTLMVRLEIECNGDGDRDFVTADEGPLPEAVGFTGAGDVQTSKPTRREEATYGSQANSDAEDGEADRQEARAGERARPVAATTT